jgi:bile acid-coenzyme A ligase
MEALPTSFGRRLTDLAASEPDTARLTLVGRDGDERPLTFGELERRANQVARELASGGVGTAGIVAIALPTCVEHVVATLAAWKLGATVLPLRSDLPSWEMDRLLELAQPSVLVSDTHTAACRVLTRADLAETEHLPADALADQVSDCINMIASSGSSGRPKLVVTPHRGVLADDPSLLPVLGSVDPVVLVTSPLYHVNGFAYTIPPLLEGATVFLMEKFEAALAVELIERHRITFTVMVPTMLQRIAKLPDVHPEQLSSIARLVTGGAKAPEWIVDRFLELIDPGRFVIIYGSSERLGYTTMTGLEWPAHRGSGGRPQDVEMSIRDADGRPLATGQVGEIHMRPLGERRLFRYVGIATPRPTDDGYYTIGDLGWLDADGYLYVADRRSDLIISGGANVFPAEVEAALSEHAAVADQVVVGVRDDEWGQRVHAIVQPVDSSHPPTAEELEAHCRRRLAAYKVPKTFELLDRLPRTEAGKLNRNDLAAVRSDLSSSS